MESKTSKAMERAVDALLDGGRVPDDVRSALSPSERAEVAHLAAAATLARHVLHAPQASPQAEESSLRRAAQAVATARPSSPPPPERPQRSGFMAWLASRWPARRTRR